MNERLRDEFANFFSRSDTLTLGYAMAVRC